MTGQRLAEQKKNHCSKSSHGAHRGGTEGHLLSVPYLTSGANAVDTLLTARRQAFARGCRALRSLSTYGNKLMTGPTSTPDALSNGTSVSPIVAQELVMLEQPGAALFLASSSACCQLRCK